MAGCACSPGAAGVCYGAWDVPADAQATEHAARRLLPCLPRGYGCGLLHRQRCEQPAQCLLGLRPDLTYGGRGPAGRDELRKNLEGNVGMIGPCCPQGLDGRLCPLALVAVANRWRVSCNGCHGVWMVCRRGASRVAVPRGGHPQRGCFRVGSAWCSTRTSGPTRRPARGQWGALWPYRTVNATPGRGVNPHHFCAASFVPFPERQPSPPDGGHVLQARQRPAFTRWGGNDHG